MAEFSEVLLPGGSRLSRRAQLPGTGFLGGVGGGERVPYRAEWGSTPSIPTWTARSPWVELVTVGGTGSSRQAYLPGCTSCGASLGLWFMAEGWSWGSSVGSGRWRPLGFGKGIEVARIVLRGAVALVGFGFVAGAMHRDAAPADRHGRLTTGLLPDGLDQVGVSDGAVARHQGQIERLGRRHDEPVPRIGEKCAGDQGEGVSYGNVDT